MHWGNTKHDSFQCDTPLMTQGRKSFGENIRKLIFRGNVIDDDLIMLANEVILNVDVF
jgi:hypothetical protein